jgi:glutamine synthetase adenylyltransferase
MVSLTDMKQAARVVKDENGQPVVQVPLDVWEAVVGKVEEKQTVPKVEMSQAEAILATLKGWENDPEYQAISEEWWDDFQQFLKDNRVNFPERDLGLGDE